MEKTSNSISAEGRVRIMSDLLKRIANYFANEYDGDDKTAPKMELSVDELRYIASMNVDRCRAEAELRELKNKRYSRTNADRIRSFSDEELAELISSGEMCAICPVCKYYCTEDCYFENEGTSKNCSKGIMEWLQSEVEK